MDLIVLVDNSINLELPRFDAVAELVKRDLWLKKWLFVT